MKWVPAADDAEAVLGSWLAMRKAFGAGPEDLVFRCDKRDGSWYRKEFVEHCWEKVAPGLGVTLTWYEATRHTFTSRALSAGASLDEVSAALGHSSPVVTKRYYDHFLRKTFSPLLRQSASPKRTRRRTWCQSRAASADVWAEYRSTDSPAAVATTVGGT